jgi:hypothetical protein
MVCLTVGLVACSVDLHNRACAALGVATTCKPTHAQVSLGKKPGAQTDLFLMIATTKDLNGRKFEIKGNVLKGCFHDQADNVEKIILLCN